MKKKIVLAVILSLLLTSVVGCGQKENVSNSNSNTTKSESTQTLSNTDKNDKDDSILKNENKEVVDNTTKTNKEPSIDLKTDSLGVFMLDGVIYNIGDPVTKLEDNGWKLELTDDSDPDTDKHIPEIILAKKDGYEVTIRAYNNKTDVLTIAGYQFYNAREELNGLDWTILDNISFLTTISEAESQKFTKSASRKEYEDKNGEDRTASEYTLWNNKYSVTIAFDNETERLLVAEAIITGDYQTAHIDEETGELMLPVIDFDDIEHSQLNGYDYIHYAAFLSEAHNATVYLNIGMNDIICEDEGYYYISYDNKNRNVKISICDAKEKEESILTENNAIANGDYITEMNEYEKIEINGYETEFRYMNTPIGLNGFFCHAVGYVKMVDDLYYRIEFSVQLNKNGWDNVNRDEVLRALVQPEVEKIIFTYVE